MNGPSDILISESSAAPQSRGRHWLILLFVVLSLPALEDRARGAVERPAASDTALQATVGRAPSRGPGVAPVLADGWSWRKVYGPIERGLGNRQRMIQAGVVGMCIALYIIWWRR